MGAFVIVLREGFEACLVVGLVLSYLHKTGAQHHRKAVWLGTLGGVLSSAGVGAILFASVAQLPEGAQKLYDATAAILASVVVSWTVFWMRRQAATLGSNLRLQVSDALTHGGGLSLAVVVFVAIVRGGVEAALFMFAAIERQGAVASCVGGGLGLASAILLGVLFYSGTVRVDLRRFFFVTSMLVIGFAAYLLAGGIAALSEAGAGQLVGSAAPAIAGVYGAALAIIYLRSPRSRSPYSQR